MNGLRPATLAMLGVAAAAVTLAHLDPWHDDRVVAPLTSNRSAARRLLPELGDIDLATASIMLTPANGPIVEVVPTDTGRHRVLADGVILGPADPEAVEGLWSSLRIATTVRAVSDDAAPILRSGGITLRWPGNERRIALGAATGDGAGVYGALLGGVEGTAGTWVLEQELAILVSQAPRAWLARRAVVAEASHIEGVRFADGPSLRRGEDGLWRGETMVLDPTAVQTRIERVLSARLDPLLPATQVPATTPWVTLHEITGAEFALATGGPCPGRPQRVIVVRGPGLAGCIDAALVQPWRLPTLLNPRLAPHAYGHVLSVVQTIPKPRTLARHGGGFRLEETLQGRPVATDVDEPEVSRWYTALHDAEVELEPGAPGEGAAPPESSPAQLRLEINTDFGVTMTLACWNAPGGSPHRCRRDGGPWLRLRTELGAVALTPDRFSDRRLVTDVAADDVRAIEILPGPATRETTVRQSAHFDLGVWRMDAPTHPDGDDAMDGTALEALLATVAGLRAEAWTDAPTTPALRTIRVDQVPRAGVAETTRIALHPDCVAVVPGRRAAIVPESSCRRLQADLLFPDPLAAWLDRAKAIEVTPAGGEPIALERAGEAWVRTDGEAIGPLRATLAHWAALRFTAIASGPAKGPAQWTLRVRPRQGSAFEVAIGEDWAQIDDAPWHYAGA